MEQQLPRIAVSMKAIIQFFETQGIKVPAALVTAMQACFQAQSLKKGSYFNREGQVCDKIAFLIKGQVIYYYNIDGKMMTRWVSLEGVFIASFSSYLRDQPAQDNLFCITDCELLVCHKEDFENLKAQFPLLQMLWVQAMEEIMIGYERRVYQLITTNAELRYQVFTDDYPEFLSQIPQKYLASMLGIEPRHLSRIRKKMASKKK